MPSFVGIILALIGYSCAAASQIMDKFLLEKVFAHPAVFAFWVACLSIAAFLLLPFQPIVPVIALWPIVLIAGFSFQWGLYLYYAIAQNEEISRASLVVGAITPIATLLLARWLLDEKLIGMQIIGFLLLIAGTFIIADTKKTFKQSTWIHLALAASSGVLFAISTVTMKMTFNSLPFIPGLVWTRLGGLMFAGALLIIPTYRQAIFASRSRPQAAKTEYFLLGHGFGAASFLFINYAVFLSSATVVNALAGIRYAIIFMLAVFLSRRWPYIFHEPLSKMVLIHKTIGLALIIAGMFAVAS